jgi:hypothetical protein
MKLGSEVSLEGLAHFNQDFTQLLTKPLCEWLLYEVIQLRIDSRLCLSNTFSVFWRDDNDVCIPPFSVLNDVNKVAFPKLVSSNHVNNVFIDVLILFGQL